MVTLKGNCADCSDLLKYYYLGGISPHYKVDRLQSEGAEQLLNSEEGHGRMFVMEDAGYKAIASSVVIGAIANADSINIKPFLLSEFVNYFIGYNPITSLQENVQLLLEGTAFPNPFTRATTITFGLTEPGQVTVSIIDRFGRVVKELANTHYTRGEHSIFWDATTTAGNKADNGLYFCRIQSGNIVQTQKLILLR